MTAVRTAGTVARMSTSGDLRRGRGQIALFAVLGVGSFFLFLMVMVCGEYECDFGSERDYQVAALAAAGVAAGSLAAAITTRVWAVAGAAAAGLAVMGYALTQINA